MQIFLIKDFYQIELTQIIAVILFWVGVGFISLMLSRQSTSVQRLKMQHGFS